MNLTEEDAKKKRCCGPEGAGASVMTTISMQDNRAIPAPGYPRYCIASECMAWRKHFEFVDAVTGGVPNPMFSFTECRDSGKGYCGLAGEIK